MTTMPNTGGSGKDASNTAPEVDTYKTPDKVSVAQLMNKDADDASLQQYKQKLLTGNIIIDENDPRQVFFDTFIIQPSGRESIEIVPAKCNAKKNEFVLKEGCEYTACIRFRVQKDIVLGLKKHASYKRACYVCIVFMHYFMSFLLVFWYIL